MPSMTALDLIIDFRRLRDDIQELAAVGRREDHSIYRIALSNDDMEGRDWLRDQIESTALD